MLLTIAQHILSNQAVSNFFAKALLKYLMGRLEDLGMPDQCVSHVLLRLFKLVFGSVNLFPEVNEVVLQPHLGDIIHRSMHLATISEDPENYFLLLRALFRSIGGGKFETLYKEFLPLLPALLNGLNRLKDGAHTEHLRELLVELCLTVPVRLSALLPYLHYLMRPLVLALKSNSDLVSQGLRTLELCIDNLSPEFLSPIIDPVRPALMDALWQHLRPAKVDDPSPPRHGTTTLRLLGKLGGRNRCVLKHPPILNPRSCKGPALRLGVAFETSDKKSTEEPARKLVYLPVDEAVKVAVDILKTDRHKQYRTEAFAFLRGALTGMLNVESAPISAMQHHLEQSIEKLSEMTHTSEAFNKPNKKCGSRDILQLILCGIFISTARPELKQLAHFMLDNTVKHCILLCTYRVSEPPSGARSAHQPSSSTGRTPSAASATASRQLDPEVIAAALVECLGSDDMDVAKAAEPKLQLILDFATSLVGSKDLACRIPLFNALCHELCASVYNLQWYKKRAGCIGIQFFMNNMPDAWVASRVLKFVKVLLFAIIDLTNQIGCKVVELASTLISQLISKCFASGPYNIFASTTTSTDSAMDVSTPQPVQAATLETPGITIAAVAAKGAEAVKIEPGMVTAPAAATKVPVAKPTPLNLAGSTAKASPTGGGQQTTVFGKLVKLLATELLSPDDNVRKQVKESLNQLERLSGIPLPDLVMHTGLKEQMAPKTTRNCPIGVQIGRMDSMTFCLRMSPPLLKFLPTENASLSTSSTPAPAQAVPATTVPTATTTGVSQAAAAIVTPGSIDTPATDATATDTATAANATASLQTGTVKASLLASTPSAPGVLTPQATSGIPTTITPAQPLGGSTQPAGGSATASSSSSSNSNSSYVKELLELCKLDDTRARMVLRLSHVSKSTLISLRCRALELVGAVTLDKAWNEVRKPVIEQFVRALLSPHEQVVQVACAGLKLLKAQVDIPNTLFQGAIRPLLEELSEYNKLNVPMLQSIARLLDILPSAFNEKLADKLYEYLGRWLREVLDDIATSVDPRQAARSAEAVKIASSIIEVFPRLDHKNKYLDSVITIVLNTEKRTGRFIGSPFRPVLLKYVEHYSPQAVGLLMKNISSDLHVRLLLDLVNTPEAVNFRRELTTNVNLIISCIFEPGEALVAKALQPQQKVEAQKLVFTGVKLVEGLGRHSPDFYKNNPALMDKIQQIWLSPAVIHRLQNVCSGVSLSRVNEPKVLIQVLIAYVRVKQDDIVALFRLLSILAYRTLVDTASLKNFFYHEIAVQYTPELKYKVIMKLILIFPLSDKPPRWKIEALNKLCIPMTLTALADGSVDKVLGVGLDGVVNKWVTTVLKLPANYEDDLKISVLQFCMTLMICAEENAQVMAQFTEPLRKTFLDFAWAITNPLSQYVWDNDEMIKSATLVLVCRLMSAFQMCPSDVLLNAHKMLIEAPTGEHTKLSRQAVTLIQPLLPRFLPPVMSNLPVWITTVIEVLEGDTQSQTRIQHIWMLVVEHEAIYNPYRQALMPMLTQSLNRGLVQSSSGSQSDHRRLSIDVASLLVRWEMEADQQRTLFMYQKVVSLCIFCRQCSSFGRKYFLWLWMGLCYTATVFAVHRERECVCVCARARARARKREIGRRGGGTQYLSVDHVVG